MPRNAKPLLFSGLVCRHTAPRYTQGLYKALSDILEESLILSLANIASFLCYGAVVILCGLNAHQQHHSWLVAALVVGGVVGLFIVAVLVLDTLLHNLHSPASPLQRWLKKHRSS